MEEDIKLLEHFINNAGIEIKTFELKGAIKNLINKYKEQKRDIQASHILLAKYSQKNEEQEKIIELMGEFINNIDVDEDICKVMGEKTYCDKYYNANNCIKCIIDYFKKKAKGE